MEVRLAKTKDIDKILDLLNQVCLVHVGIRPDLFKPGTKYNHRELEEIIADETRPIFVCTDDEDTVLGYGFCIIEDYHGIDVRTPIKSIYIDDICVDENKRRMHVANHIYDAIVDYARKIGCYNITLNVWEGNDSARSFYDNMGMKIQKTVLETII